MRTVKKILHNENGFNYIVLDGETGTKALLVRVKNDNSLLFVVCHILEKNSWCGGTYFDNLNESMKYYRSI